MGGTLKTLPRSPKIQDGGFLVPERLWIFSSVELRRVFYHGPLRSIPQRPPGTPTTTATAAGVVLGAVALPPMPNGLDTIVVALPLVLPPSRLTRVPRYWYVQVHPTFL